MKSMDRGDKTRIHIIHLLKHDATMQLISEIMISLTLLTRQGQVLLLQLIALLIKVAFSHLRITVWTPSLMNFTGTIDLEEVLQRQTKD